MTSYAKETLPANLEQEMRRSYLDYAMSVIVGRALPDARDGLKPVHRRILYAMSELRNDWNRPYKKSARIVGDVIGKYHPHGDSSIYDAIVRMAQDFSMRYILIDGQGNFGSVDGDSAAAMRYTEVRLSKLAHQLLVDIDKDTIEFGPNYDETEEQPLVLPTRLPNLLMNGSDGIAVGMATKIPPHNLTEIINGCLALIDNERITVAELIEHIPGPDFPTAGIINGRRGIVDAYTTGRGSILVRAKAEIITPEDGGRQSIIVTELPFQIKKAPLIEKIAALVTEDRLEGIHNLRDESDKDGLRIVIEVRRSIYADTVLNNLFAKTPMQSSYGINLVALANNQPRVFNLKQLLEEFISHRRDVTRRRLLFELVKARAEAHLKEGYAVALSNLDEILALIRAAGNRSEARAGLKGRAWDSAVVLGMLHGSAEDYQPEDVEAGTGVTEDGYLLSTKQADAILDLQLHKLTGLEQDKIFDEFKAILAEIDTNIQLLGDPQKFMRLIRDELIAARDEYGENDDRRTLIIDEELGLDDEDLITPEDMVVTISHAGYAKRHPVSAYNTQHRGGKGKTAAKTKEDDFVTQMFVANTHDSIFCFTNYGKVFRIKVYQLRLAGRSAKGMPLVNMLRLAEGEKVTAVLPVQSYDEAKYVVMAMRSGRIKKSRLQDFRNLRSNGLIAVRLQDGDELLNVGLTDGESDIVLLSDAGRAVRFHESKVRAMGRVAAGVLGMRLEESQSVISMMLIPPDVGEDLYALLIDSKGQGKRTRVSGFPVKGRATKGVVTLPQKKRNNTKMMGALLVDEDDEVVLITDGGSLIRMNMHKISIIGRAAAGVRLMDVHEEEFLVSAAVVTDVGEDQRDEPSEADETP